MEMSYNIPAEIKVFTGLPLAGMGMGVGKGRGKARPRPSVPSSCAVPKKKRRTNAKGSQSASQKCPTVQDLMPPQLSGYGDTIILKNPFDDSPPTTSQSTLMNVGASVTGQYVQPYRMGVPTVRDMSPMMPAMNVMGPPMSHNIDNIRPTVNRMNHVGGYVLMVNNQAAPSTSFMSPMNNMGQKVTNEFMNINNPIKMGQTAPAGNPMNKMSANNCTINGPPMSINNTNNGQAVRPLNLPVKNVNKQQGQTCVPFNFDCISNDVESVEQLMNMDIIGLNEIERPSCQMTPSNNCATPSMGPPMNLNDPIRHLNVHNTLEMQLNQHSNEKIYPADQSIICNFQNLHAPPIYPCGICHKEVNDNDQGIICESGCNCWFHRGCLGLTEVAFQLLTQEIYAEWVCDNCLYTKNIPMVKFKP